LLLDWCQTAPIAISAGKPLSCRRCNSSGSSLLRAIHYQPNARGAPTQRMYGYYENWLRRTPEGWKFTKIVQHIDWNEGNWYVFEKAAEITE